MQPIDIFLPVCGLVFVTLLVWLWMYKLRITAIVKGRVNTQDLADETKALAVFKNVMNPSDNFENLFELPVLFYAATLIIFVTNHVDVIYIALAWAFVFLRAAHSFIHCTSNTVIHRFRTYALGAVVLWAMWIRLAIQLLYSAS